MGMQSPVRVWVRSLGQSCRLRVENVEQAHWVLARLEEKSALEGLSQIDIRPTEAGCLFEIPNASLRTLASLEVALGEIPEVELMLSPEAT
jgi:hypothetical protein